MKEVKDYKICDRIEFIDKNQCEIKGEVRGIQENNQQVAISIKLDKDSSLKAHYYTAIFPKRRKK